jgi:lipopolysaccharide/colanic/teichoic acid biosynthesis glycosyltransferase
MNLRTPMNMPAVHNSLRPRRKGQLTKKQAVYDIYYIKNWTIWLEF